MYLDDRIIARQSLSAGGLCVLAHADDVQLCDGSTLQLHAVHAHRLPMLTLRALATAGGRLLLIDLARIAPRLDAELRDCPRRDIAGYVLYSLRQLFATSAQFNATAQRVASGTWWPVGDGYVWHPAARAVCGELLRTADAQCGNPTQGTLLAAAWSAAC